ncbi:MAG: type VI secretion system tube protein Hcp [Gemmatimonadota bacterium]|nr:type VI secretion system tube protein Hcp [Gemmatimonadota bacterium]
MPTPKRITSLFSTLMLAAPLTAAKTPAPTPESRLRSMMLAYEFSVQIEGTKQGKFKGDPGRAGGAASDKIRGLAFQYEVTSPRDLASGQATGKRQHKPIIVTKEWGASSPQLFEALATNEVLKVTFEFLTTKADGTEEVFETIKLANATISDIKQYTTGLVDGAGKSATTARHLEDVSFTFQKIEMENRDGKTSWVDDLGGVSRKPD